MLKLWLAVNHLPPSLDDSHGFWRRVRLIPFGRASDPDAEPSLLETLRAELPGILAWAVRGALAWRERGLGSPDAVMAATATYREESDPLGDFLAARCLQGPGLEVRAAAAYAGYRAWAETEGMREREVVSGQVLRRANDGPLRQARPQQRQGLSRRGFERRRTDHDEGDGSGEGS